MILHLPSSASHQGGRVNVRIAARATAQIRTLPPRSGDIPVAEAWHTREKIASCLLSLSVFVVPGIVYMLLRAVTDP